MMFKVTEEEISPKPSFEDLALDKRKRKALSVSSIVCPVCGLSVRTVDLGSHFKVELDRLNTVNTKKSVDARKKKMNSKKHDKRRNRPGEQEGKNAKGDVIWNRAGSAERRMKFSEIQGRRRRRQAQVLLVDQVQQEEFVAPTSPSTSGPSLSCLCPVCGNDISADERSMTCHVEQCIAKRDGCNIQSGSDDGSESFEEYTWAGQTRVRATSMLESGLSSIEGKTMRLSTTDENEELNIDEEDSCLYGAPQYFEKDIIPCPTDEPTENKAREQLRAAMVGDQISKDVTPCRTSKWGADDLKNERVELNGCSSSLDCQEERTMDPSQIIKMLRGGICKLETLCSEQPRCLICMESYQDPLVSVVCWHVHCEECWLRTLGAKKLCPQCNVITSPSDLRKIYL